MAAKAKKNAQPKKKAIAKKPPPKKKVESEDESSSEEEEAPTQRVIAPKRVFKGDDKTDFVSWKRHIRLWKSRYATTDEEILGSYLMDAITGKAERCVNARVQSGEETYTTIMAALEKRYGDRTIPSISKHIQKLNNMKRGKQSLASFLDDYEEARQEAILYGWRESPETDGVQLMQACDLSITQQVGILSRLQAEGATPSYEGMMSELELLASTLQMADDMQGKAKEKSGEQAFFAPGGKGKGKGKGNDGKGKGQGKVVCRHYMKTGSCKYGERCKFSHSQGGKGKGGKGKGKGKGVCYDFQKGSCWRGANCRYSHTKGENIITTEPKVEPVAAPAGAASGGKNT